MLWHSLALRRCAPNPRWSRHGFGGDEIVNGWATTLRVTEDSGHGPSRA